MKIVFPLLFAALLVSGMASSQTLKKYPIDKSGCSAYFLCNPGKFDFSFSPDSSKVYTGECAAADITYYIICVEMKDRIDDLDVAEEVLVQYLDYVKSSFKVVKAIGYGKGNTLKGKPATRGVTDYWEDDEKNNIKVKAWTEGKYIAVLMATSKKELPEARINAFLDGIVFP